MTARGYDVVVVGAGPAGLAAADTAARGGASTLLVDEQMRPGGQIYRAVTNSPLRERRTLGASYRKGLDLVRAFEASGAEYRPNTMVWNVARDLELGLSSGGVASLVPARHVILATGATERAFPIAGWTLPGVMTAGAAQILLKSSGVAMDGGVLAGTGPLVWLLAAQEIRAGGRITAILDTTPRRNWTRVWRHLWAFASSPYLREGVALVREARRHVKIISGVNHVRAEGNGRLERVVYRRSGGREERLATDSLLLHQGVIPNVNLSNAVGCALEWDSAQCCWRPQRDAWGATTVAGVSIAGDGAGVLGAQAAEEQGRLTALDALERLGRLSRDARNAAAREPRRRLLAAAGGREFLEALFLPSEAFRIPDDETIVCRCEEVSAGQIREAVRLGATGPNQVKSFLRCGMGPCQGRFCAVTLTELIAAERRLSPAEVGHLRLRPPAKPITLAELAAMPASDADVKAVVRL